MSYVFVLKVLLDIAAYPRPLPHYALLLACRIGSLLTHSYDEVGSMHMAVIPIARWWRAGVAWLAFEGHYVIVSIVYVFNLRAAPACVLRRSTCNLRSHFGTNGHRL